MKKSIIGISSSVQNSKNGRFENYETSVINSDYVRSIETAGGVPMGILSTDNEESLRHQIAAMDGIVLHGGHDVNPMLYNEELLEKTGTFVRKQDILDGLIVKLALEMKKPILGVCRGSQILNVVLGGTLYQDMSYIDGAHLKHDQWNNPGESSHFTEVEKDSRLFNIVGSDKIAINSFHHQAVKEPGKNMKVIARAKDGIIEGIELDDKDHFVMGLQWHPEMMAAEGDETMAKLFRSFIEECGMNGN